MVDNLECFLKEAIGQKYELNMGKMMRRSTQTFKPSKNQDGTERQLINEDRTFFCSELVAKAMKTLGILINDNTSSSRFHPVHFSAKGEGFLKLTPDTRLEEEL